MADDSANLRVGAGSRQLDYSSSGNYGGNSGTSISTGTYVWYLALNALNAPMDAFTECNVVPCGHHETANVHQPCPERINCVPHVPPKKPHKKSSGGGGGGGGNNDDNKVIHWGDDGHWANDGHSQWSDDGNYWYDDGGWDDDAWANDGYWYWDDDGHNGQAKWLANNGTTQSNKNKILYPLMFVGLVVGALAVALVARRVSGDQIGLIDFSLFHMFFVSFCLPDIFIFPFHYQLRTRDVVRKKSTTQASNQVTLHLHPRRRRSGTKSSAATRRRAGIPLLFSLLLKMRVWEVTSLRCRMTMIEAWVTEA